MKVSSYQVQSLGPQMLKADTFWVFCKLHMTSNYRCPQDAEYFQEPGFIKVALYVLKTS